MKERIIKYLACPECSSELQLQKHNAPDSSRHIMDGKLICTGCKAEYPIIKGVPCFSLNLTDPNVDKNRNNFADEWNYFTQELDIKNEKLAKDELDSYFNPFITYEDLSEKIVLDGGCGGGRFTYIVGRESNAKEIFGIDLSSAVFTAFKNTKNIDKVTIIQGDITKLPFKKDKLFDFIYSVGVLHHLPAPHEGFNSLVNYLKDNGTILAWVYGKEGNFLYITFADPIRKLLTSKLPFKLNLFLSFILSLFVWFIIWILYFPLNLIFGGKIANTILPMNEYFNFFRKRGFKDFWRTVLDKMVPTISHHIRGEEFKNWFISNNLKHKILFRNGHSWLGIGNYLKSTFKSDKEEKLEQIIN